MIFILTIIPFTIAFLFALTTEIKQITRNRQ